MICPNCREDNAPTFRFCGMCGTSLEPRRPAGSPLAVSASPVPTKIATPPDSQRPFVGENATNVANKQVPSISGPSMLGLDQPSASPPVLNQHIPNQPSIDSLREKSFSGLDSFFEPEPAKNRGGRILLLVALLAALGWAGWWTYTNYLGVAESQKSATATTNTAQPPADTPTTKPAPKETSSAPDPGSTQPAMPSAPVPEGPSENANAKPNAAPDADAKQATPAQPSAASSVPANKAAPTLAPADKHSAKRETPVASSRSAKLPPPVPADTGDADFHKAEAYLYGRGERENCDEAVKYLKAASAKSNAKARSAFGTMYATGHCAPRDLPTSYLWFALALRADPNNQILEKDLSAVWNQMTPPERQQATRMKQ